MTEILIAGAVIGSIYALIVWFQRGSHTADDRETTDTWGEDLPARRRRVAAEHCPAPSLKLPPIPASRTLAGRAYVIDGDTICIQNTKIRLAGIDAPELDMPWGQKAKWAMVFICRGQKITAKLNGERSFDRLVGTCYLPDGRDIGAEIVKQGLALDLPSFSNGKYRQYEPDGARRRLANGKFGHRSLTTAQNRPRAD